MIAEINLLPKKETRQPIRLVLLFGAALLLLAGSVLYWLIDRADHRQAMLEAELKKSASGARCTGGENEKYRRTEGARRAGEGGEMGGTLSAEISAVAAGIDKAASRTRIHDECDVLGSDKDDHGGAV